MTEQKRYISEHRSTRTLRGTLAVVGLAAGVLAAGFTTLQHERPVVLEADTLEAPAGDSVRSPDEMPHDSISGHDPERASETKPLVLAEGPASYYGDELAGRPTANGERFDPSKMTAAHPSLPFGTRLRVTNLRNGESTVVRVNDRGPFVGRRIIDLSYAAARKIGMIRSGTAPVRIEILR